jgi:uncharacterized protein
MFPCTKCGICCKSIGRLVTEARNEKSNDDKLLQEVRVFPFEINNNVCSKYEEGIGCTVYDTRPDICNIDTMYERYYKPTGMTKPEYYSFNAAGCNLLIDEFNVDPSKKVFLK